MSWSWRELGVVLRSFFFANGISVGFLCGRVDRNSLIFSSIRRYILQVFGVRCAQSQWSSSSSTTAVVVAASPGKHRNLESGLSCRRWDIQITTKSDNWAELLYLQPVQPAS